MSFFDSIRDALFGATTSNAYGVQLVDARQGALYFLANNAVRLKKIQTDTHQSDWEVIEA
ncbi:hypothetical protein [Parendozoicomonas sp. Alg238-R29]|uniref:hypothetical protein n=1 Tax=Parendozoicomonas sp. Alg238-R29 TaxID=2993446 RepID=UPI00248DB54A|nr:hypothetical protein [Parendozoicomonas sp. Alg238-R29]